MNTARLNPNINNIITRYPWLIPLLWFVGRNRCREFAVDTLAEELGVSTRLARSLVFYGRRLGFIVKSKGGLYSPRCDGRGMPEILACGRVYIVDVGGVFYVARVSRRRVRWFTVPRKLVECGDLGEGRLRARVELVKRLAVGSSSCRP